jgi:hypothetical protein
MIQVSQNLDALAAASLAEEVRSIKEELEEEGEVDQVILTRLESVAFNLETHARAERIQKVKGAV